MRMYRRFFALVPLAALAAILVGLPATASGRDDDRQFTAQLNGYNETPSINTLGSGALRLSLNADSIDFTLTYRDLTLAPAVAHIHFAQAGVAGAVVVFFCGGGGKPSCPTTTSGTVSGTITAANVQAVPAQGIKAGDLASLMRAIRSGATYANMHTPPNFPSGEIRGQIHPAENHGRGDPHDED
jgi:hypothetical protein